MYMFWNTLKLKYLQFIIQYKDKNNFAKKQKIRHRKETTVTPTEGSKGKAEERTNYQLKAVVWFSAIEKTQQAKYILGLTDLTFTA